MHPTFVSEVSYVYVCSFLVGVPRGMPLATCDLGVKAPTHTHSICMFMCLFVCAFVCEVIINMKLDLQDAITNEKLRIQNSRAVHPPPLSLSLSQKNGLDTSWIPSPITKTPREKKINKK